MNDTPTNLRRVFARDITAGDRLLVAPYVEGYPTPPTPWAGPEITRVESDAIQTNVWTINGGRRSFAPGDVVTVCDLATDPDAWHCDECGALIDSATAGCPCDPADMSRAESAQARGWES
jgi:hypothetical protein